MTFDEFLPHVLPSVAGCPDAVAMDHVIKAARVFCARTLVWNYETDTPTLTVVGQTLYPIDLDTDQERVKIITAWLDDAQMLVIDQSLGRRTSRMGLGRSCVYAANALDFVMAPTPTVADQRIAMHIAVKPALSATVWPDELVEHVTDIAHGAIATLCMLPRMEWTNDKLASMSMSLFERRIGTIGMNVSRGFTQTQQHARVNFF